MSRLWIGLAGLYGAVAVGMAAASAHALAGAPAATVRIVDSGVQMQFWHALALLGCGILAQRGQRLANAAAACLALGTLMFCGAVYAVGLAGVSLGPVAPTGGLLLIAGWLLLAAGSLLRPRA